MEYGRGRVIKRGCIWCSNWCQAKLGWRVGAADAEKLVLRQLATNCGQISCSRHGVGRSGRLKLFREPLNLVCENLVCENLVCGNLVCGEAVNLICRQYVCSVMTGLHLSCSHLRQFEGCD